MNNKIRFTITTLLIIVMMLCTILIMISNKFIIGSVLAFIALFIVSPEKMEV